MTCANASLQHMLWAAILRPCHSAVDAAVKQLSTRRPGRGLCVTRALVTPHMNHFFLRHAYRECGRWARVVEFSEWALWTATTAWHCHLEFASCENTCSYTLDSI